MQRYFVIGGGAFALIALLGAALLFIGNGEQTALARLDAAIASYDGDYLEASYDPGTDHLVVEGLTLRDYAFNADDEPLDLIEIGRLSVFGLARNGLAGAFQNDRQQQIFDQLEMLDIALTEDGQVITVQSLMLQDVSVQPLDGAVGETLGREQLAARALLMLVTSDMEVVGFASPGEGTTGMQFDRAHLNGIEGGVIDAIIVEGLRLWDKGQVGTVGDSVDLTMRFATLDGFDARAPLRRVFEGETVRFDRQSDIPMFARLMVEDLTVEEEAGATLSVGSLTLENHAYRGAMATETTFVLEDLRVPLDSDLMDQSQTQSLTELGYGELIFDLTYVSAFDVDAQIFRLENLTVGIEDLGELSMELTLENIPFTEEMIDQTTAALLSQGFVTQLLENATLGEGRLTATDNGLVQRIISLNAARAGLSTEIYLAQAQADLAVQRIEMASSPLAVQSIDALSTFLQEPNSVAVSVSPTAPVTFSQIIIAGQINPVLLVEMLNLQIRAED